MPIANAEAIIDVADHLFTAIEQSDTGILNEVFNHDITVWRTGAGRDNDKERTLRVLTWFINRTAKRRYQVLDRQIFDDGTNGAFSRGFVQQHILHATRNTTGEPIAIRVCMVVKLGENGLISRIDEYFDPAELAPLQR